MLSMASMPSVSDSGSSCVSSSSVSSSDANADARAHGAPHGLQNRHRENQCYVNSTLHALRAALGNFVNIAAEETRSPQTAYYQLAKLWAPLGYGESQESRKLKILRAVRCRDPLWATRFDERSQQDVSEFLRALLDTFTHKHSLQLQHQQDQDPDGLALRALPHGQKVAFPVRSISYKKLLVRQCAHCGGQPCGPDDDVRSSTEALLHVGPFPAQAQEGKHVQALVTSRQPQQAVSTAVCRSCFNKRLDNTYEHVAAAPSVLVIRVERAVQDGHRADGKPKWVKSMTPLIVQEDALLNLTVRAEDEDDKMSDGEGEPHHTDRKALYQLWSAVLHRGRRLNEGHYVSAGTDDHGQVYFADDTDVRFYKKKTLVQLLKDRQVSGWSETVSLLFYRRVRRVQLIGWGGAPETVLAPFVKTLRSALIPNAPVNYYLTLRNEISSTPGKAKMLPAQRQGRTLDDSKRVDCLPNDAVVCVSGEITFIGLDMVSRRVQVSPDTLVAEFDALVGNGITPLQAVFWVGMRRLQRNSTLRKALVRIGDVVTARKPTVGGGKKKPCKRLPRPEESSSEAEAELEFDLGAYVAAAAKESAAAASRSKLAVARGRKNSRNRPPRPQEGKRRFVLAAEKTLQ